MRTPILKFPNFSPYLTFKAASIEFLFMIQGKNFSIEPTKTKIEYMMLTDKPDKRN